MSKYIFRTLFSLGVLTGALVSNSGAQTISQQFDGANGGTFLNDYNQDGPNAPNFFQNTVGGGINNSNAVDLTSNTGDATVMFRNTAFNLSAGTPTATISAYFRNQQIGGGTAVGAFQLGFGSDAGDVANTPNTGTAFNGAGTYSPDSVKNFLGARLRGDGAVEFQTGLGGVTTNSGITATNTLTAGNFYFLTVSFTRSLSANTFSGTVSLFNSDSAGVLGSQIATTSSAALTNSAIWTDSTTYAGFRAAGQTSGANGANLVDNFSASVVPEPSVALLGGIGALGSILRRRRA